MYADRNGGEEERKLWAGRCAGPEMLLRREEGDVDKPR